MKRHIPLLLLFIGWMGLMGFGCQPKKQADESVLALEDTVPHVYEYGICIDSMNLNRFEIRPGDNPALIFAFAECAKKRKVLYH